MKTKLTITVDEEVLPRAKAYARARGESLSRVIECALRELTSDEAPPFSNRWRGKLQASERDDERYRHLSGKYA